MNFTGDRIEIKQQHAEFDDFVVLRIKACGFGIKHHATAKLVAS